jgi:hypothetical protein
MVTVRRSERRRTSGFALFEYGYRPFFLLAALHGIVLVPIWVAAVFGWLALPVEMEVSWHAHEMVYGFAAAGLAGFMLTAVPNWTGAPPLRGAPLAGLALLWLVGRLAMTLPAVFPPQVGAGIDLAFIPALVLGIIGPLVAARKAHNLMLLIPLAVFWIGDWMMQAQFTGIGEGTAGTGSRIGIDVMLLMITVIGGRIIPTFTTNALHASGSSVGAISVPLVDRSAIAAVALLIIVEAVTENERNDRGRRARRCGVECYQVGGPARRADPALADFVDPAPRLSVADRRAGAEGCRGIERYGAGQCGAARADSRRDRHDAARDVTRRARPHRPAIERSCADRGCVCAHFGCGGAARRRGADPNRVHGPADRVRHYMGCRICPFPMRLRSDTRDAPTRR